jgi:S1-C subfamily serine protease
LIAYGEVRRGQLGVSIQNLTPTLAKAMGIEQTTGAVVSSVAPASPAESAGLKSGDVIVGINGQPIRTSSELRNTVGLTLPGTRVEISYLRDGRQRVATTTLAAAQPRQVRLGSSRGQPGVARDVPLAGVELAPLPERHPLARELKGGVLVTEVAPGSAASREGLQDGDVTVAPCELFACGAMAAGWETCRREPSQSYCP